MNDTTLTDLINIGVKLESVLHEVGIFTPQDLRRVGAIGAHQMIQNAYPHKVLPVCYYLYSFDGAISNTHWRDIGQERKELLKKVLRTKINSTL